MEFLSGQLEHEIPWKTVDIALHSLDEGFGLDAA